MSLFGWCSTGHHNECRIEFLDWNAKQVKCTCECHEGGN